MWTLTQIYRITKNLMKRMAGRVFRPDDMLTCQSDSIVRDLPSLLHGWFATLGQQDALGLFISIQKFILQILGTLNRAFWAWNWYKRLISGFKVCFFNNCIEKVKNWFKINISKGGGGYKCPLQNVSCLDFSLNPEMTLLHQFHAQKALFKVPKSSI